MSVQSEINRISGNVTAALEAIAAKGVNVGSGSNSDDLATLIAAIEKGILLPALTNEGAAADLLNGKQLIDDEGNIVTGSMPSVTQATPSISVNSSGLITASATQSAGKVAAGTKSATKQLTVQAAQTITPGTSDKTIASGRYLTGTQTIKGDANLLAENIKSGVSIFGVDGTASGGTGNDVDYSPFTFIRWGTYIPAANTNKLYKTDVQLGNNNWKAVLYLFAKNPSSANQANAARYFVRNGTSFVLITSNNYDKNALSSGDYVDLGSKYFLQAGVEYLYVTGEMQ